MTLDKARERYASALRSTFVSRSEPEVGKTYDLVDEDAADSLIAALGDEIAELTGQNIDLEVWRASAVKRAEQAEAEATEAWQKCREHEAEVAIRDRMLVAEYDSPTPKTAGYMRWFTDLLARYEEAHHD